MPERHEARQLLKSLLDYVASDGFRPGTALSVEGMARVLRTEDCEVVVGAPTPEPEKAGLWVRAGALRTKPEQAPWTNDADIVVTRKEGFDYAVAGDTVVLPAGTAWTSKQGLSVNLVLPPATTGNLSIRLRTSDAAPAIAQLQLGDGLHETVMVSPEARGMWVSLPFAQGQAHDGHVKLSLESEGAPVLITELALIPDAAPQPK